MGVPKFFRYISERYPCLSTLVDETEIPEYDNFYIDANGIIHNCSHPDDSVLFRITEEQMFKDIFYYFEVLFDIIKPKKLFFIAIDGVAPRAKMNQQRGRRFRTAKDAENALEDAIKKNQILPDSERFDSNCITPGTEFMEKLHRQLQYFIKYKISNDVFWQKPKIILSGHNVPGEGEHKIMDYIRYLRSQNDWDPNTRHCLHGLDADLIMLGLCTHELHFSLLREEVKFGRQSNNKRPKTDDTKFYLLHLSLMRDYLDLEFQSLKNTLPFEYHIEKIIDDWVLMGFLVGNDFIPNLPNFHIAENSLNALYQAYINVLPTLGGYINNSGTLNMERFEKYLNKLSSIDFDKFKDVNADLKYFESKTGKAFPGTAGADTIMNDDYLSPEVLQMAKDTEAMLCLEDEDDEDCSDDDNLFEEFIKHKAHHYKHKLEYEKVDRETLREQAEGYIRAIQWNLFYYYTGCPSWSWFYPHHYSPYVSDINGFSNLEVKFELSKPFLPFQQLLAVLPAASKSIIPQPFQELMTSDESPIKEFYPDKFETDLNGKKNDWEAVVLIPFIDEKSLLSAMEPHYKELTEEENMRNTVKPMEIYTFTPENLGSYKAPHYFPTITENHAKTSFLYTSEIALPPKDVVKGRLPGAVSGAYIGFPHLRGIPFTAYLESAHVQVFEFPSRLESMILKVRYDAIENEELLQAIAKDLLNQIVFVGWPHIKRGKVISIATNKYKFQMDNGAVRKYEYNEEESEEIVRFHKQILGIFLGTVNIIVNVKTVDGIRCNFLDGGKVQSCYLWSSSIRAFPYQTIMKSAAVLDKDEEVGKVKNLNEIFIKGLDVFILTPQDYGSFGKVTRVTENHQIEVSIESLLDIDLCGVFDISNKTELKYFPGYIAAQRLGMGTFLFSRVTGSVFIQTIENNEKLNVGLGLKFTKQGEELVGFTKKEGNTWYYSEKTIALLNSYMEKFPELFQYLEKNTGNDIFFSKDVYPENTKEKVNEIKEWLKSQPHMSAERRPSGSKLITNEALMEIRNRISAAQTSHKSSSSLITVHPSKIFIPSLYLGKAPPDPPARVKILDRIITARNYHSIPIGLTGTVIGCVKSPKDDNMVAFDVVFDKPVTPWFNNSDDSEERLLDSNEDGSMVYKLPARVLIDISYGRSQSKSIHDNRVNQTSYLDVNSKVNSIGNCKVKQFFNGFIPASTAKVTSPQDRNSMPYFANNLPSNNRVEPKADSEFHAFWNVLQTHNTAEEKPLRPQVSVAEKVSSTQSAPGIPVVEQTNALKKLLRINATGRETQGSGELRPQVPANQMPSSTTRTAPHKTSLVHQNEHSPQHITKPCGHLSCCSELVNLCAKKNIPYPIYKYSKIPTTGEFTCAVTFYSETINYGTYVGITHESKEDAAESAACKAVRAIMSQGDFQRAPLPSGLLLHHPIRHPTHTLSRFGLGQLPTPPMQWCSNGRPMSAFRGPDNNVNRRSPRGQTPPNSFQAGPKLMSNQPTTSGFNNQPTTSGFNNQPTTSGFNDNRIISTNRKNERDKKTAGVKELNPPHVHKPSNPTTQVQRKPRSKPRLAANFSVPISNNLTP